MLLIPTNSFIIRNSYQLIFIFLYVCKYIKLINTIDNILELFADFNMHQLEMLVFICH